MTWIRTIGVMSGCVSLSLVGALAACGDEDDAAGDEPPWGLEDVELPADEAAIAAVFEAMPDEIDGRSKELLTDESKLHVSYEEAIEGTPSMMAVDLSPLTQAMPEAGEIDGLRYLEIVMEVGPEEVDPGGVTGTIDQVSLDPSAGLVWGVGTTIEVGTTPELDVVAPSMLFAEPDGDWVFNVTASTEEMLVEIVTAFCEASG
jgi:hypothetical protein